MNEAASLPLALLIGAAFGASLERAGLGNATKLAGQFCLRDFTVIKVMMSAMLTAMLGAFWLSRLGVIDLSALYVPETYLLPQLAGGLIFGVGFAISGLCPGTSCVAAASGRGDGIATIFGVFGGVLATGLTLPRFQAFYGSTAHGAWTVPQLTGLPYGVVVALVSVFGVALLAGVERFERRV